MIDNQNMPMNSPEKLLAPDSEFVPDIQHRQGVVIAAVADVAMSGVEI